MAAARDAGVPVWLVVDVGRRLPAPLFDALVAGAGAGPDVEVVACAEAERAVEPRRVACPVPPELLRPRGAR